MKAGQASATARIIAAATVMDALDPATADLVPPGAASWCEAFLSTTGADRRLLASARSPAGRAWWRLVERATHPGIVRHWLLRKRWIESRVRGAITDGASQLVILGAGLDTLGVRLAAERPDLRVVEVDHPATLAVKRPVVEARMGSGGPLLAEADLSRDDVSGRLLPTALIDPVRHTVFVAEGLLMYLPESRVRALLTELAGATSAPARLVFSFMIARPEGSIGFEPRSAPVSWWLARKGEPFEWSLDPATADSFARELGWSVTAHADADVLARLDCAAGASRALARGEDVIEARSLR